MKYYVPSTVIRPHRSPPVMVPNGPGSLAQGRTAWASL